MKIKLYTKFGFEDIYIIADKDLSKVKEFLHKTELEANWK